MVKTQKPEPKKMVALMLDEDVLEVLEAHALVVREKRNAIVQRLVLEYLTKCGAWPPVKKEKRPRG